MNTLAHLTLNTGHLRMSPRSEVFAGSIKLLDPIIIAAGGVVGGIYLRVLKRGKTACAFSIGTKSHVMIFGFLCWDEAGADLAWKMSSSVYRGQHDQEPAAAQPEHVPWLAVQLPTNDNALLQRIGTPEMWAEIGDLERCIAWTILAQEGLCS